MRWITAQEADSLAYKFDQSLSAISQIESGIEHSAKNGERKFTEIVGNVGELLVEEFTKRGFAVILKPGGFIEISW